MGLFVFEELGISLDILTIIIFVIFVIVLFYGTNFQGYLAKRQIMRGRSLLKQWRKYGMKIIHALIEPIRSETMTYQDIDRFIEQTLNFFVISPAEMDPPHYAKINFLLMRREQRFRQIIKNFLPQIDDSLLAKLTIILLTTMEIDRIYIKVRHNYIVGKKTKSTWYIMQSAAELTQILTNAKAYRVALDSFNSTKPIGDSIGPLVISQLIQEHHFSIIQQPEFIEGQSEGQSENQSEIQSIEKKSYEMITETMILQKLEFEKRKCYCIRAKGPECLIGNPGAALEVFFNQNPTLIPQIKLIITIDAMMRLESETSGSIAQGLGAAIGGGENEHLDRYKIETIATAQNPPIPIESIVCKESLEESVSEMSEEIASSIPEIIRLLKTNIRTLTHPNEIVIIFGIGNALGVKN